MPEPIAADRWIAVLESREARWGGERRRSHIFRRLAERTGGEIVPGWSWEDIRAALPPAPFATRWLGSRAVGPHLVSGEMLEPWIVRRLRRQADLVAVAIYDDPISQQSALGFGMPWDRKRYLRGKRETNVRAFRWKVMPTLAMAELAGIPLETVIAGENGTDTATIVPGIWPQEPAIAFSSGAAPGRGIEALIQAARLLRSEIPALRLLLSLVSTGPESEDYLDNLRSGIRRERWIEVDAVPMDDLGFALRQATLFCIPHPAHPHMDATLPVKIFDAMASGRPLVITPRTETQRLVERYGVGVVSSGDSPDELAAAMLPLLTNESEARRLGATARHIAETVYDWPIVGDRIASAILEREGFGPGYGLPSASTGPASAR